MSDAKPLTAHEEVFWRDRWPPSTKRIWATLDATRAELELERTRAVLGRLMLEVRGSLSLSLTRSFTEEEWHLSEAVREALALLKEKGE